MALVVPASDIEGTKLNGIITAMSAEVTAAGANGPLIAFHTAAKAQAQLQLVIHLLSTAGGGKGLNASTVLANETYGT